METTVVPQFSLLSDAQCEAIHTASLEILRKLGVQVHHPEALRLLREAGAVVSDDDVVRIPAALVEWALQQPPSRIALCRRGSSEVVARLEGMETNFGPGSDCSNFLDPATGTHRPFTTTDLVACIRLVESLPEMAFCMSMGIPTDFAPISPFRQQYALMLEHSTKPVVFISADGADCEAIIAMAAAAAGGIEQLRMNPTLLGYSQAASPLKHPHESLEKLLCMADKSIPTVHQPSPMMGGTAPVTMAGGLALGNAEVLSGIVIHQLKNAGAPIIYGSGQHHIDMRTTISVYGAPEFSLARAAVADLARYYRLPHWGYAGHSDSCAMDEQAAADSALSVLVALLTGQHLAHDVGYLEAGLTTSPEMIVFTCEMIDMLRHFSAGFAIDAESMAMEVIEAVGIGGDYLMSDHTLRHFRSLWQPTLFSRKRMADWLRGGSHDLGDRLRDRTIALMEKASSPELSDSVRSEIDYILAQSPRLEN